MRDKLRRFLVDKVRLNNDSDVFGFSACLSALIIFIVAILVKAPAIGVFFIVFSGTLGFLYYVVYKTIKWIMKEE